MNAADQIECVPYSCSLSVGSCAARHARSQEPPRVGRSRGHLTHCIGCAEGRERWVQLGSKRHEAPKTVPDLRRIHERAQAVYYPRTGQP